MRGSIGTRAHLAVGLIGVSVLGALALVRIAQDLFQDVIQDVPLAWLP